VGRRELDENLGAAPLVVSRSGLVDHVVEPDAQLEGVRILCDGGGQVQAVKAMVEVADAVIAPVRLGVASGKRLPRGVGACRVGVALDASRPEGAEAPFERR